VYEALATIGVLAVMASVLASGLFARRRAGAFLFGIALWAVARMDVAFTWRDPAVVGPLSADQVLAIVIATGALALLAVVTMRDESPVSGPAGPDAPRFSPDPEPDWPDPAARPRI